MLATVGSIGQPFVELSTSATTDAELSIDVQPVASFYTTRAAVAGAGLMCAMTVPSCAWGVMNSTAGRALRSTTAQSISGMATR